MPSDEVPSDAMEAANAFLYEESDRGWLSAELEHKQLNAATIRIAAVLHAYASKRVAEAVEREREECATIAGDLARHYADLFEDNAKRADEVAREACNDISLRIRSRGGAK
jgi:hypothetical protein